MSDAPWQDNIPARLIDELEERSDLVRFTDGWNGLSEGERERIARDWLRGALGLERWR